MQQLPLPPVLALRPPSSILPPRRGTIPQTVLHLQLLQHDHDLLDIEQDDLALQRHPVLRADRVRAKPHRRVARHVQRLVVGGDQLVEAGVHGEVERRAVRALARDHVQHHLHQRAVQPQHVVERLALDGALLQVAQCPSQHVEAGAGGLEDAAAAAPVVWPGR